jgi:LCP family protein required for cell wall assembly
VFRRKSLLERAMERQIRERFGPPERSRYTGFRRGFNTGFIGAALVSGALIVAWLVLFPPLGRLNILLLGVDRRPEETFASRTDTMILTTLSAPDNYIGLLSIPRDLWVALPNGTENRINTAHFLAEAFKPDTGPAAAMQTVRSNFGVTVDRYVRVDFNGFVRIVDSVGGIELDIPRPLIDDEYPTADYGVQQVEFAAGRQWLDGERALQYARIRHGSSDLQRAERQAAVIQAFAARLAQPGAWVRFPALLAAVQESISTDVSLTDLIRMAPTLLRVGPGGLDQRVIDADMVQPFQTQSGASVLAPRWDRINPVLLEMFGQ